MRSYSVVGRAEVGWDQFHCKMMILLPQLFLCLCDDFNFFSSACFVQQHHPLIRQGGRDGQHSLTWDCCKCFVTMGRGWDLESSTSISHTLLQLEAGGDGLNSFCVIYSEKPAFPYLLWRTARSWERCTHPGWPKSPPTQAGHLWLWFLVTAICKHWVFPACKTV